MANEWLWLIFALTNFVLLIGMYKLFGKMGIFVWVGIATILANIQVIKSVELFGYIATLGNIMYGTIFLGTDALNEIFGKKSAKKAVYMGFYVMIASLILMQLSILFQPSASDTGQGALVTIFQFWFWVVLGSMTAFIVSQLLDVTLFQWIKSKLPGNRWLWLRNNGSTMISQAIDTIIFVSIGLSSFYIFQDLVEIALTTYVIKVIVAALDTPFLYLMKRIKPLELFEEKG